MMIDIDCRVMAPQNHEVFNTMLHGKDLNPVFVLDELDKAAGTTEGRYPDVSVIISSSWQHIHSLQELQGFFGGWGHRVIGTTTSIDASGALLANRFQECLAVAEQLGVSDWVIVDDQPGIVWGSQIPARELVRRVIWCDPVLGLATPLVVDSIMKRFRGATRTNSD